jgi:outer membrane receptor for ferrienterochelin and colicin
MKEGNSHAFTGNIAISPIAGALTVEGPIKKEVASFILSGRRTWLDGLFRVGQALANPGFSTFYNFYDLNAKINWKASERHRFYLSFYNGRDGFGAKWDDAKKPGRYLYSWGNLSVAGRWNWVISPRLFNNTTLYYSRFKYNNETRRYREDNGQEETARYTSALEEVTLKSDFHFLPGENHQVRYGLSVSRTYLEPEMATRSLAPADAAWHDTTAGRAWLLEGYAEDEWRAGRRWRVNYGARGTLLAAGRARYYSLEPRLSLAYLLSASTSLKASFSMMQQPIHLLANSSLAWKTDMWVPVSDRVKPARSRLYSLGVYHVTRAGIELSAELYYNDLRRVIRYRDGVNVLKQKDESWQEYIHTGEGRGYGVEFMVSKTSGNLNGWVAYTLSRAERRFNGIAGGAGLPFEYDRRHKANAVANYTFAARKEARYRKMLAVNFTYASGNYITIGDETYAGLPLPWEDPERAAWSHSQESISRPNNVHLPAYHHLDVVLHLQNRSGKGGSWSFGVYNIYARQNPSFYYRKWESNVKFAYKKVSLLPFVPIISWNYKF